MANKQMTNLSINNRYLKEENALYRKAYSSLLEAIGNFAADNPEIDLVPLGQISTDIQKRLTAGLDKAQTLRVKY